MWRRRRIAIAPGSELRPTPDRVRETLFNWLDPTLRGARCLDLYAGTGVLGFEALSRGAAAAVLVERDAGAVAALERVRDELRAEAEIVRADAAAYLARPGVGGFDIVFVDPPYRAAARPVLESLLRRLEAGARIYLERERGAEWPELARLRWLKRGKAGSVEFGLGEVIERAIPSCDGPGWAGLQ
jgi:16S rRNA (guanine(966)-N(2))-methyltransferase RsmD